MSRLLNLDRPAQTSIRHRSGKLRDSRITLSHGSGGKAMRDLIDDVFVGSFDNAMLAPLEDRARLNLSDLVAQGDRLAFTTDSYVVDPLFFPGGDIGALAVNGTINDLAVSGARPLYLSCSVILEEGLSVETLRRAAHSMAKTARAANVAIVTGIHCLRDATRGGVATVLNEFAQAASVCIRFDETSIPVCEPVKGVCEILGLDPLYMANEGKLVAVVPRASADTVLAAMRAHPVGRDSAIVGEVIAEPQGVVLLRTVFGGERIVDMLVGEQLPRIC